jgi:hypothetical protein
MEALFACCAPPCGKSIIIGNWRLTASYHEDCYHLIVTYLAQWIDKKQPISNKLCVAMHGLGLLTSKALVGLGT